MTFNGKQLSAIAQLAIAMAQADGHVEEEETNVISLELMGFGLDKTAATLLLLQAAKMDAAEALSCVRLMTNEQKKYVTGFFAAVMTADKDIDDSEVKLWSLISLLADLPTMTISEALIFWSTH